MQSGAMQSFPLIVRLLNHVRYSVAFYTETQAKTIKLIHVFFAFF